jgi:hypothetical protein
MPTIWCLSRRFGEIPEVGGRLPHTGERGGRGSPVSRGDGIRTHGPYVANVSQLRTKCLSRLGSQS